MPHDLTLISTVSVGFVCAAILGYIADRLRLPALVGYLIAGIIIGPFTPGFTADGDLAQQLAELGVILLMFGVGLHFSLADLMAVRNIALRGAVLQIVAVTGLGMALGVAWGWGYADGLIFGLSLSVASTVVLLKALEERNLLGSVAGSVSIGWLVVEDVAMVVVLVLVPILAEVLGTAGAPAETGGAWAIATAIFITFAKVAGFVALAVTVGPRVVPWLLTQFARTGSRELFTLAVLAIALGIAFGSAALFGVSFALGAFFAGVIMSESRLGHRAASDSLPLQNAFSVLFFISVGMLFDPSIVLHQPFEVLSVLLLITVGKMAVTLAIVLLLGYPFRMALNVGAGLAQIGEFSFILAGLGASLGLLSTEGQDLILAGAIGSIILNPLLFALSSKAIEAAGRRLPAKALAYGGHRMDQITASLDRNREAKDAQNRLREAELQRLLEIFPLFSEVDANSQEELLLMFRPRTASPGDYIFRTGAYGDAMYFLSAGAVEVQVNGAAIPLEAGSYFGEMALLSGGRRSADVVAVDFCQFLVLDRRDFSIFMSRHPSVRKIMTKMAKERAAQNSQAAAAGQET